MSKGCLLVGDQHGDAPIERTPLLGGVVAHRMLIPISLRDQAVRAIPIPSS